MRISVFYFLVAAVFFLTWRHAACDEFEPGLVTKIVGKYAAVNLGTDEGIADGDTLWVFRERDSRQQYIGILRILTAREKMSSAEVLVTRKGMSIEVLDRVGQKPLSLSLLDDTQVDNFSFMRQATDWSGEAPISRELGGDSRAEGSGRDMMPKVLLFTAGGIGVGVSAACAGLAVYHDYKHKYDDDPVSAAHHLEKYQDYRNMRNIALISTAAVLTIAVISHYLAR